MILSVANSHSTVENRVHIVGQFVRGEGGGKREREKERERERERENHITPRKLNHILDL